MTIQWLTVALMVSAPMVATAQFTLDDDAANKLVAQWMSAAPPKLREDYTDPASIDALVRVATHEQFVNQHGGQIASLLAKGAFGQEPAHLLSAISALADFEGIGALLDRLPGRGDIDAGQATWLGTATELLVLADLHKQGRLVSLPMEFKGHLNGFTTSKSQDFRFEVDGFISDTKGYQFIEIKRIANRAFQETNVASAYDKVGRTAALLGKPGLLIFATASRYITDVINFTRALSKDPSPAPIRIANLRVVPETGMVSPMHILFAPAKIVTSPPVLPALLTASLVGKREPRPVYQSTLSPKIRGYLQSKRKWDPFDDVPRRTRR